MGFFFSPRQTRGTISLWDGIWGQVIKNTIGGISQGRQSAAQREIKDWEPKNSSPVVAAKRGEMPPPPPLLSTEKSADLWVGSLWLPSSEGSLWVPTLKAANLNSGRGKFANKLKRERILLMVTLKGHAGCPLAVREPSFILTALLPHPPKCLNGPFSTAVHHWALVPGNCYREELI